MADFKECIPIRDNKGNITDVLNTRTGKLETKSEREKLGFNFGNGKLGVIKEQPGIQTDNQIQLGMAEDGFFYKSEVLTPLFE